MISDLRDGVACGLYKLFNQFLIEEDLPFWCANHRNETCPMKARKAETCAEVEHDFLHKNYALVMPEFMSETK